MNQIKHQELWGSREQSRKCHYTTINVSGASTQAHRIIQVGWDYRMPPAAVCPTSVPKAKRNMIGKDARKGNKGDWRSWRRNSLVWKTNNQGEIKIKNLRMSRGTTNCSSWIIEEFYQKNIKKLHPPTVLLSAATPPWGMLRLTMKLRVCNQAQVKRMLWAHHGFHTGLLF